MPEIPRHIRTVLETLVRAGYDAFLVGGCVRDLIRGAEPSDWDVASSSLPRETAALFPKTAMTGEKYGTVTVLTERGGVEVTTFRADGEYPEGIRKPESVEFTRDILTDLSRRDFTVNAIAMSAGGAVTDPFGGRDDIAAGVIRCVGDPEARFREDPLRMLRAVRFHARLGYRIEDNTRAAIAKLARLTPSLSRERVRDESVKILMADPAALAYCAAAGLLEPTVSARFREFAGADGMIDAIGKLPQELEPRLAAFAAVFAAAGAVSSPRGFLRELRLPNGVIAASGGGAEAALEREFPASRPDYKRLCARIGDGAARAACAARDALYPGDANLAALDGIIASGEVRNIGGLALDGRDLAALGVPPGREIGETLRLLLEHVIENPRGNTREELGRLVMDTPDLLRN